MARGSAGKEGGWECQPACFWPSWCWPWRTPAAESGESLGQIVPPEINETDMLAQVLFSGKLLGQVSQN